MKGIHYSTGFSRSYEKPTKKITNETIGWNHKWNYWLQMHSIANLWDCLLRQMVDVWCVLMVTGWSFGHPSIELLCGKTLSFRYLLVTNIDLLYHDSILYNVYSCVYCLCVFLRWLQVHHLKIVLPPKEPRPFNGSSHLQQVYPFFRNVYVAH